MDTDRSVFRLPDFLIIGAARSGTTSLFYYLRQHPDLFMPQPKEPGYFAFAGLHDLHPHTRVGDIWRMHVTDLASYASLFARAPQSALLGEATPEYMLLADETIRNIRSTYEDRAARVRFIAIVRNPVDRIWSHYWVMIRNGYEDLPFAEAVSPRTIASRLSAGWHPTYDYVGYGMYGRQLTQYMDAFGRGSLKVVLFDDLQRDAIGTCASLFQFLGVDSAFTPDVSERHNPSAAPRFDGLDRWLFRDEHLVKRVARRTLGNERLERIRAVLIHLNSQKVEMRAEDRRNLVGVYEDDVRLLSRHIDRDLSHWLRR